MIEQFYLTHRWNHKKLLPIWVKVDLAVISMKGNYTLLKPSKQVFHRQIKFNAIPRTHVGEEGLNLTSQGHFTYFLVPVDWVGVYFSFIINCNRFFNLPKLMSIQNFLFLDSLPSLDERT